MTIGLILILIILCVNPFSLLSLMEPGYQMLHNGCLKRVQIGAGLWPGTGAGTGAGTGTGANTLLSDAIQEPTENLNILYSAFICGERLPDGEIKKTFIALGIIHLTVISGAHLIFLEKIWNLLPVFRFKNILLALFLLTYSMSAGLSPPILRALFSLLLARINKKLKLFWSPYIRVHISGLLCLLCQNNWFHSLSLQLSWIASLGMSNHRLSRFKSCVLTFLLILPIVSQWGGVHPLSIILNWLITPLAACVLLPLSLLTVPFPILRFFTDEIWKYFLYGMNLFKPLTENRRIELSWSLSSFQIWIYICIFFISLHLYFVYSMRKESEKSIEQGGNYTESV
ncbi:MAG: hypothetical protein F4X95_03845 [Oligoflexia bacterium]|nr:hypothetical protein [Oligoflexia bacterium]